MYCCKKSKRRKRESRLEHGVHLEEEIVPLEEVQDTAEASHSLGKMPDTADENGRKAAKEKLGKILEEMTKELKPLESINETFQWLSYEVQNVKKLCQYGPKHVFENLLKITKNEAIERMKKNRDEREKKEKMLENELLNIEREITPKALMGCKSSSLLMSMKVSFKLHTLADKKGADEEKFKQLANSVEAFISHLLDPLRSGPSGRNDEKKLLGAWILDSIIEDAIDLDQKKFFTHPVVEDEMNRKFYGRFSKKDSWKWWQLLLFRFFYFWCAVDWCIFPILFKVFSLMKERSKQVKKRKSKPRKKVEEEEEEKQEQEQEQEEEEEKKRKKEDSENGSEERSKDIYSVPYVIYWSPCAKFLRDTLSYIIMVVLHYALCLSPSTIAFSRLEWAILIFFVGRFLVERQQICNIRQRIKQEEEKKTDEEEKRDEENKRKQGKDKGCAKCSRDLSKTLSKYLSDPWNLLDFISILMYLIVLILRVTTVLRSGSEMNNRVLAIAGYLYSFNTLCLTLRVFGYITEQSRHLGVIQIALFNILQDISTIILQFLAGILAFSIAITKVYMAEKSFIASGDARNDITCQSSGLSCWWAMVTHLGWSLLGQSEKSDFMASVDSPSDIIVQILYAAFLVFAVVLLLNMLIALLCNTYQRIEDNSLKVWLMKRAVTIQTYDAYDPAPVPLNIVYNIGKLLIWLVRKLMGRKEPEKKATIVEAWIQKPAIEELEMMYCRVYDDSFPVTDEDKFQLVMQKQDERLKRLEEENRKNLEKNRQHFEKRVEEVQELIKLGLYATFTLQGGGSEMWEHQHGKLRIEDPLLTCDKNYRPSIYGARYLEPFSAEFSHFEVVILEDGKQGIGIGVVYEGYKLNVMPGTQDGTVGFIIENGNGKIFHDPFTRQNTKALFQRNDLKYNGGDRILCKVYFNKEELKDGKKQVAVSFFLNGRKSFDQFFIDSDRPLYPYVCMTQGGSVLAKMCPRNIEDKIEALDRKVEDKIEALDRKVEDKIEALKRKVEDGIEVLERKLNTVLARMTDVREKHEMWKVHPGLSIEGRQLTCECRECAKPDVCCLHGARYRNNLSPEFPHFEVVILETGEKRGLGIGLVRDHCYMNVMPGWDAGSIGYHINDGIICPKQEETKGKICFARTDVIAQRGDRIRCTVMFENETVMNERVDVPVLFFLNGRKIITQEGEDQFFINFNKPLFPYICMTDGVSVLAKICPREVCKIEDVESKVTKSLGKTRWKCDKMWELCQGIGIERHVLTCKDVEEDDTCGARYRKPFSAEFPHFEVVILETLDERRYLGLGAVFEDYSTRLMPGMEDGTVGYHTDGGKVYQTNSGKITEGSVLPNRGDRIRITVSLENEKLNDGKRQVPVSFFLNGRKIITLQRKEDQFFMDCDRPLYPYVGMMGNCRVWAKMLEKDKPEAKLPVWLEEFIKKSKLWECRFYACRGIQIEDHVLTCKDAEEGETFGARRRKSFSNEFPHFEVVILDTVDLKRYLGLGVVFENYDTRRMPGEVRGTMGYRTDNGKVYHMWKEDEIKGPVKARRGDRIRLTVMFKDENVEEKQVPVSFFLNGKKMITSFGENQFFINYKRPLYPYVGIKGDCRAWAKMLGKDEPDELPTWLEEFIERVKQEENEPET